MHYVRKRKRDQETASTSHPTPPTAADAKVCGPPSAPDIKVCGSYRNHQKKIFVGSAIVTEKNCVN